MMIAKDIDVIRSNRHLLHNVNLQVGEGITALLGANGAGKTTLLKVLSGDISPNKGDVDFFGRSLKTWNRKTLARKRAVLTQEHNFAFPFTVEEIVLLGRTPFSGEKNLKEEREIVYQNLKHVDAAHLMGRFYPILSGGEKQRVQLARVLTQMEIGQKKNEERFLFLDEPTSSLDLKHQHSLLQLVRGILTDRIHVLIVLHDLQLAEKYADTLVFLKEGRIVAEGAISTVFNPQVIEEVYGIEVDMVESEKHGRLLVPK